MTQTFISQTIIPSKQVRFSRNSYASDIILDLSYVSRNSYVSDISLDKVGQVSKNQLCKLYFTCLKLGFQETVM